MIRSGIWRELGLFLATLAVALQIGGMAAHLAHAAVPDIHLVWCSSDADQPVADIAPACPLCHLPTADGFLPPVAAAPARAVFFVEYARVESDAVQRPCEEPQQARAPPG